MYAITAPRCTIDYELRNLVQKFSPIREDLKKLLSGIYLHRGRTDSNGGHLDWINAMGWGYFAYHYHHGMGPHLHPNGKCPYENMKDSIIINPYTGKKINIGKPYVFEDNHYYALDLVSKALTADDERGIIFSTDEKRGLFFACSTGDSTKESPGKAFVFTYSMDFLILLHNELFTTDDGKLQLLAASDGTNTNVYISLETIHNYMTKDGYFTGFSDDGSGVWSFEVRKPIVHIIPLIPPENRASFHVGDEVTVQANIEHVASARLIVGNYFFGYTDGFEEHRYNLENEPTVAFSKFKLTEDVIGNASIEKGSLTIRVEGHTGGTAIDAEIDARTLGDAVSIRIGNSEIAGNSISFDDAIKKAVPLTCAFEGSSYTKLVGNFDGQGISFGLLQWNIGQGTLQPLLQQMDNNHNQIMRNIFGIQYYSISAMLSQSISDQLKWAVSINDSNNKVLVVWDQCFTALGNTVEFQAIQLSAINDYITQAQKIFNDFGLTTERGVALAFDIAVQNWSVKTGTSIINSNMTELQKLSAMANSVSLQSASTYQKDVLDRKMTIVNGIGTVHGIQYNLSSDYGIGDLIIK